MIPGFSTLIISSLKAPAVLSTPSQFFYASPQKSVLNKSNRPKRNVFGGHVVFESTSRRFFEVTAEAHPHGQAGAPAGKPAHPHAVMFGLTGGFVDEMRTIAMKLHTKDQAPKEGEKAESDLPLAKWRPTKEDFMMFLVDSQLMYNTIENLVQELDYPEYLPFRATGLERSAALAKDIEALKAEGMEVPSPGPAGRAYADLLTELAKTDPPAFICHFYNIYFAHSAGGRMIGQMMSNLVLDGRTLEFYKWDRDLKDLLPEVKAKINEVSEPWSREKKDHCLQETQKSFEYSGALMAETLAKAAPVSA
mmetsp:Transcript_25786/g.44418  ORF Transcript_25786/g.44418 Transcript_25786/m.44418 type:complete len:307 (+) Transcript_25786:83-1003(+)|eukprot:CAMPEP_0196656172 /NCGR_PEP_ID=MMETSP1086-20130531/13632_1 /TAXON_ID=77921 /ORGANISM="Cyanoptyche  gloeocystis , Strain SAG4.97" /LENGTH=306 /DNA_ID=CAMNT_0041988803 /DNA_START=83 /DNA_END=1003 /DNA_ORIENTATION=+